MNKNNKYQILFFTLGVYSFNSAAMIRPPSSQSQLVQQFADVIKGFPQRKDLIALNQKLAEVRMELQKPNPDLFTVVSTLNQFKSLAQSLPNKNEVFQSPSYGTINFQQFVTILDDSFINPLTKQLQSEPEKLTPPQKTAASAKPIGLSNAGNSCFMNAALQSLISLERLNTILLNPGTPKLYIPNSISVQYINLVKAITTSSTTYDPLPFCLSGWQLMKVDPLSQQDAREFTQLLLQRLISEDINRSVVPSGTNDAIASLFLLTLGTGVENNITREQKRTITKGDITIELPLSASYKTLLDSLKDNFKREVVGNNKTISVLFGVSDYLLVTLKREQFALKPNKETVVTKNEQPISFALSNFDISSLSMGRYTFAPYHLKACIIHNGIPGGGHYTAYVRRGSNWFFCNDSSITPVALPEMQMISQRGYGATPQDTPVMFFYEK